MPTKRKRHSRARRADLPFGWRMHLECGHDYFHDGFGDDYEAMRQAWQEHGAAFMASRSDDDRLSRVTPWALEEFGEPPGFIELATMQTGKVSHGSNE